MPTKRTVAAPLTAKQAMIAASRYILFHYPTMYTGALPRRLVLPNLEVWTVPIVLTHPEHGVVGLEIKRPVRALLAAAPSPVRPLVPRCRGW